MKNFNIQKFVLTAVLGALTCASTMVIHIHSPIGGYINLGDSFVILSGFLLGPLFGAISSGIGSGFADFFTGHPIYVPGTIIIKGIMAFCASLIFKTFKKSLLGSFLATLTAELIMVFGYIFYEWVFMGMGYGAMAGVLANLVQAGFALILSLIITAVFKKNKFLSKYLDGDQF